MDVEFRNIPDTIKKNLNIEHGVIVIKNNNQRLYKAIGLNSRYIITSINDIDINSITDIIELNETYGPDFEDRIKKIELINRHGQKKEYIFR